MGKQQVIVVPAPAHRGRKFVGFVVGVLLVAFVLASPLTAAEAVTEIFGWLFRAGASIGGFVQSL